jgi:hypothetical protein
MNNVQRKKMRIQAELRDKIKKDIRNGIITKTKAKAKKQKVR